MLGQIVIQRFREGDASAFRKIYHCFYNDIWSVCFKYSRNEEVAEELTHDAFLILWQKRELIDPEQGVKAYLFSIARHEVFRWLKKNALNAVFKAEHKVQLLNDQRSVRQDIAIDAALDLARMKTFLDGFPPKRRKVFELIKFGELSYNEVAERLSISRDAVKDHMVKANQSIRKLNSTGEFTYGFILFAFLFFS
ncbi:putative ECF-type RNA polymerase [Pedobacter sp. BAL39]|uniref:RNA polymerase sigma factor n=1 Tax=Pedobacter sp. BAL39 TaxID=391596 RepID=UPI00015598D2|nr:sigma-70 family RNA polymerase sigma factor [Pedobacter sp. BAL39]EDM37275.1 putative ECF-type RNA polymerase [Pedobacter sp. BAL39]